MDDPKKQKPEENKSTVSPCPVKSFVYSGRAEGE